MNTEYTFFAKHKHLLQMLLLWIQSFVQTSITLHYSTTKIMHQDEVKACKHHTLHLKLNKNVSKSNFKASPCLSEWTVQSKILTLNRILLIKNAQNRKGSQSYLLRNKFMEDMTFKRGKWHLHSQYQINKHNHQTMCQLFGPPQDRFA